MPRRARAKARDKRMNAYFDKIVKHVGIDYSNREIRDIHTAVFEMVYRTRIRINERGLFNITRVQTAGSMADKTSLWKSTIPEGNRYLEFDFLGVLDGSCTSQEEENCSGCMRVESVSVNQELLRRYGYVNSEGRLVSDGYIYNSSHILDAVFMLEANVSVVSLCNCFVVKKGTEHSYEYPYVVYSFYPVSPDSQAGCSECTVTMPTGQLQLAIGIDNIVQKFTRCCSLMLQWSSYAKSLRAPDQETFENIHQCTFLPIFVDFLPAVERFTLSAEGRHSTHLEFLVPKRCCNFPHSTLTWRKSVCLTETDAIRNKMSPVHRQAFMVLKFVFAVLDWDKPYHIKTAVLNHHVTCTDKTENCAKCVIKILRDLQHAYNCHVLKAFNLDINLLYSTYSDSFDEELKLVHQLEMKQGEDTVSAVMSTLSDNFTHRKNSTVLSSQEFVQQVRDKSSSKY